MPIRCRYSIRGRVQGVGFRPTVFRLARELALTGLVRNDTLGVTVEVEGPQAKILEFQRRLRAELPLPGRIDEMVETVLPPRGDVDFTIEPSDVDGNKETTVLADIAPCVECLRELRDPSNRRYRYPFINCTHCGPRFTLITAVPYDRPNTTMSGFVQCDRCLAEYRDPTNRRFHAQPNACPLCGPHVRLTVSTGRTLAERDVALARSVDALRRGEIVAVQGVGGFQLLVDATNPDAVRRLRTRKQRYEKPLAVMVASVDEAHRHAALEPAEVAWLRSPEAPIVLVTRRRGSTLAPPVAPGNPRVGLMLPSSPLHHLLLSDLGLPVVATSGNLSEEPIAITEDEAQRRLGTIADLLLVHDRPIARHADDSVLTVIGAQPQVWRRARGFAPLPVALSKRSPVVLGMGGHQKNTIALSVGDRCFLSQHIGDLDTLETRQALLRVIDDFVRLYDVTPQAIAHDLHPDYASTQIAEQLTARGGRFASVPRIAVQHHHAHMAACLAEACVAEPALGIIWDGSGLGTDGTLWGGEFLYGNAEGYTRVASFLPMRLPGGDRVARSPRRIALAFLLQHFPSDWLSQQNLTCISETPDSELRLLEAQLHKPALSPRTSSVGRLFDAVASILDLRQEATFEGQAAMALEFITPREPEDAYPITFEERTLASQVLTATAPAPDSSVGHRPRYTLDAQEMLSAIVTDRRKGLATERIAARFHAGLVTAMVDVAHKVGVETVVLSGGCFQNRRLAEWSRSALARKGHRVLLHQEVPPNDGGLALGQVAVACSQLSRG